MKVSIVTPSYNQAQFLEETILSVLDQDYPDVEYAVVDGGSTDGSVEIIRRYEDRLAWWQSAPDRGQPDAINQGFARATGDALAWLNSDDTLLAGAVAEMVSELEADPTLVMVYGDALYIDEGSNRTGYLASRRWDPAEMVRCCDNHVVQPSAMWRREAWERAGPLNEDAYYFFDFEFILRLSVLGTVKRVPRPWATYREHPASKTMGDQVRKAEDYLRFADKWLQSGELPEGLRRYVRQSRSSARLAAGDYLYWELDLPRARRTLWAGLALYPRNASRRSLPLAFKSLLPKPVVRRLRARRNAARRG
jgi:glycosyltransferase involved in cell wall biosynthesis